MLVVYDISAYFTPYLFTRTREKMYILHNSGAKVRRFHDTAYRKLLNIIKLPRFNTQTMNELYKTDKKHVKSDVKQMHNSLKTSYRCV